MAGNCAGLGYDGQAYAGEQVGAIKNPLMLGGFVFS